MNSARGHRPSGFQLNFSISVAQDAPGIAGGAGRRLIPRVLAFFWRRGIVSDMADILNYLGAGVIGGLGVAAFTAWRTSAENRVTRQVEHLSRQITRLYGPVHDLCQANDGVRSRSKQLTDATSEEYATKPREDNSPEASAAIDADMERCGRIQNNYADEINTNHIKIISLLEKHYTLADIEDLPVIHSLKLNLKLSKMETLEHGRTFPPKIYLRLSPVDYSTPDFSERINQRYVEKMKTLDEWRDHRSLCWQWIKSRFDQISDKVSR
jgi:hypothetical protein